MKIRLVCCDVDGTLVNEQKRVSARMKEILAQLSHTGCAFSLASGRNKEGLQAIWKQLSIRGYSVCCNGTYVMDENNRLIFDNSYKLPHRKRFLQMLDTADIRGLLTFADYDYMEETLYRELTIHVAWAKRIRTFPQGTYTESIPDESFYKISLYMPDAMQAAYIQKQAAALQVRLCHAQDGFYDVLLHGHEKADGVRFVADWLQIPREEILCIGDNENDISMLRYAGIGVAMGNATDFVKSYADIVCDSNENDGAADIIRRLVL